MFERYGEATNHHLTNIFETVLQIEQMSVDVSLMQIISMDVLFY